MKAGRIYEPLSCYSTFTNHSGRSDAPAWLFPLDMEVFKSNEHWEHGVAGSSTQRVSKETGSGNTWYGAQIPNYRTQASHFPISDPCLQPENTKDQKLTISTIIMYVGSYLRVRQSGNCSWNWLWYAFPPLHAEEMGDYSYLFPPNKHVEAPCLSGGGGDGAERWVEGLSVPSPRLQYQEATGHSALRKYNIIKNLKNS